MRNYGGNWVSLDLRGCEAVQGQLRGAVAITEPSFNDVFFALNSSGGLVQSSRVVVVTVRTPPARPIR